jgi:hypothetical protein
MRSLQKTVNVALYMNESQVDGVVTIWREHDRDSLRGRNVPARHERMHPKNQYFHSSENVVYRAP